MRAFLVLSFLFVAACDAPCLQLANRICDCENDTNSQAACRNQVSLDLNNVTPNTSKEDTAYCLEKLKSCTCNALNRGDRKACGFEKE